MQHLSFKTIEWFCDAEHVFLFISPESYLGATVEIISCGSIHEALLQVDAGVDAPWQDQFSRGIDDFCSARDHQLLSHLLDDAVLDVDVGILGAVVVDHLPALNQDPRHG